MSNNKINPNEFLYYLHGTRLEEKEIIESIFTEGLKDYYGTSINSTMKEISYEDIKKCGLSELMKVHTEGEHKSVFLIKIPKKYMALVLHRDNTIDFPVPLLKKTDERNKLNERVYMLTPNLVQGVYNSTTDMFITNPNFCPVFNPNGLEYSDEQINNFWAINQIQWVKYAESRKKYSYEQLYSEDTRRKSFDDYINSYSKYFNVKIKNIEKVDLTEYGEKLNSQYELDKMITDNTSSNIINTNNKK